MNQETTFKIDDVMVLRNKHVHNCKDNFSISINPKIILLGDLYIDETSLLKKYIYKSFDRIICSTTSPHFKTYLDIDDAAIFIYDTTKKDSFKQIDLLLKELLSNLPSRIPPQLYLIVNNIELAEREVSIIEGNDYAKKYNMKYLEDSIKTEEDWKRIIRNIAVSLALAPEKKLKSGGRGGGIG